MAFPGWLRRMGLRKALDVPVPPELADLGFRFAARVRTHPEPNCLPTMDIFESDCMLVVEVPYHWPGDPRTFVAPPGSPLTASAILGGKSAWLPLHSLRIGAPHEERTTFPELVRLVRSGELPLKDHTFKRVSVSRLPST